MFGAKNLSRREIQGRKVLEVGSYNVNGSLRPILEAWKPARYTGIDIKEGSGVDIACNAESILEKFGKESFDAVISTELLEHVKDWKKVISNIKNVCKPNGIILITTRSHGASYHGYPSDFWRYELDDMENIFSDCKILVLEKDFETPGVFIKVKKPHNFIEKDLSGYKLYSIVVNKRVNRIIDKDLRNFYVMHLMLKEKIKNFILKVSKFVFSKI